MSDTPAFPPADLTAFLALCAGEWMALRSSFELDQPGTAEGAAERTAEATAAGGDRRNGTSAEGATDEAEPWHRSERGELRIEHQAGIAPGEAGCLLVTPPAEATAGSPGAGSGPRRLQFRADGGFSSEAAGPLGTAGTDTPQQGRWQLWPDGSLELVLQEGETEIRERIWFTKPNLRLRSCVARGPGARPQRASFSSEIRRVRRAET
ncbi:MAG: phycobiliprotein lyase [Synechococcaceae cyanobacterium]|nr:phycobiliprotein lyase [Synechococcaceae cyanobacterium]